jgi:hypothetical protein
MYYNSRLSLSDAIVYADQFCPVEIYYNGTLVWSDRLDESEWIPMELAVKQFESRLANDYKRIIIGRVSIEVVEFHHSIIRLKGKRIRRDRK